MSERVHTLVGGVRVRVTGMGCIDLQLPGKEEWMRITGDERDSLILIKIIDIEVAAVRALRR